jgi:hypothetical protein
VARLSAISSALRQCIGVLDVGTLHLTLAGHHGPRYWQCSQPPSEADSSDIVTMSLTSRKRYNRRLIFYGKTRRRDAGTRELPLE